MLFAGSSLCDPDACGASRFFTTPRPGLILARLLSVLCCPQIHLLPVLDAGHLVGVVSPADIIRQARVGGAGGGSTRSQYRRNCVDCVFSGGAAAPPPRIIVLLARAPLPAGE